VEFVFITQDSKAVFNWVRDKMYREPEWIQELENGRVTRLPELLFRPALQ